MNPSIHPTDSTDQTDQTDINGEFAGLLAFAEVGVVGSWSPVGWVALGAAAVIGGHMLSSAARSCGSCHSVIVYPHPHRRRAKPIERKHTENARQSTKDAHQKGATRKNQKDTDRKRQKPGWHQR